VEICGKVSRSIDCGESHRLSACSACAGDYEDPDYTAPPEAEVMESNDGEAERIAVEDFLSDGETRQE
jgi:hypothetical protein